jgi:hypothetical protein
MPDISGFTEFVNNTEIEHGQHIISELLELIVNSNKLKMTVSEIEGDAVLFYKLESVPTFDELLDQSIELFTEFHQHLKRYEYDRICDCGACSTASSLSLKMIIHSGELGFTKVNKQKKIFGKDLIIVHKLLKNDIGLSEYLLFSDEIIKLLPTNKNLTKGVSKYDKIGEIHYQYLPLDKYLEQIDFSFSRSIAIKVDKPIINKAIIDRPIDEVFELLTNLKYRIDWNTDLDDLLVEKDNINKNGTIHQCLVDGRSIDFETIKEGFNEGEKEFGEKLLTLPPGIKSAIIYYRLSSVSNQTLLVHETHLVAIPVIGWIMKFIFSKIFNKNTKTALVAFKSFCEVNR